MNKLGFSAILAGLLVGCAQPPLSDPAVAYPPITIVRGPRPTDAGAEAFRDIGRYGNFTQRMLVDEATRLDATEDNDPYAGLRLMILLWMLDRPESVERLEALANRLGHDSDPRVATPARILANAISTQRRLGERESELEKMVNEAQRHLGERESELEKKVNEAQRRIDQLTAKIEALKSLEKDLVSRPEPKLQAPDTPRAEPR